MAPRRTMTNTKKMAGFSAAAVATVALFGCSDDDNGKKEETCADQTDCTTCTTFGTDDCEWTEALCNVAANLDFTANDGELCKALFDDAAFVTIEAACVHPCASVDRQPTPLTFATDNTATGSWTNGSEGPRCNGTVERTFTEGTFTLTGVTVDANCGNENQIYSRAELEGLEITEPIDFNDIDDVAVTWSGDADGTATDCAAVLNYTADTNVFTYDLAVDPADVNCDATDVAQAVFDALLPAASDAACLAADDEFACEVAAGVDGAAICAYSSGTNCTADPASDEEACATAAETEECVIDPERYECNGDLSTISCEDTDASTCELKVAGVVANTENNVCVFQAGECTDAPVIETKSCAVNGDFGFDEEDACDEQDGCSWVKQECQTDAAKIILSDDACTSAGGDFTVATCVDLCEAIEVSVLSPADFPVPGDTLPDVFFNVIDGSGGRCRATLVNTAGVYSTDGEVNCTNAELTEAQLIDLIPMETEQDILCSAVLSNLCEVSQTGECEAPDQTCGAETDETTCQTPGAFANCQFTQATCDLSDVTTDPCLAADLATCITEDFSGFCSAAGDQVCEGTYEVVV